MIMAEWILLTVKRQQSDNNVTRDFPVWYPSAESGRQENQACPDVK